MSARFSRPALVGCLGMLAITKLLVPAEPAISNRVMAGEFGAAPPAGGDVRIVSWNIDRGFHVDRVASALRERNPDLCLLQEVDCNDRRTENRDIARDLARQLRYNYSFGIEFQELSQSVNGAPAYQGQATLSRWPIARARVLRFERQSSWWKPHEIIPNRPFFQRRLGGRIALVTELKVSGRLLVVYNLHLESRSGGAIQTAQLDEMLADLDHYPPGTPAILGGDFNSKYHPLALLHSLEKQGWHSVLGERVERTHVIVGYLDWIFIRGEAIKDGTVLRGSRASDHDAVWAELTMPGPAR